MRAHWDLEAHPLRPVLTLAQPVTPTDVFIRVAEGVVSLVEAHAFGGRKDLDYSALEARRALELAGTPQAEVLAALMSDAAVTEDDKVVPTPLCFIFGQGHQHFLERLARVPAMSAPPARGKGKMKRTVSEAQCLAETLFEEWMRPDQTEGFRWDPSEDRRYALRADDPSGDPPGLQHGANRLAAVGLPALSGAAVLRRSQMRFLARGTSYQPNGRIVITWPIWSRPARLSAIRALLAHPALASDAIDTTELTRLGVAGAMRAERISVGKFMNVTPANPLT